MENFITKILLAVAAPLIGHILGLVLLGIARKRVFHWAAEGNVKKFERSLEIVEKFKRTSSGTFGLIFDAKDKVGMTPLMYAAREGHKEVVTLLLNKGANVNIRSTVGWTAQLLAESNGHEEIANLLKEKELEAQGKPDASRGMAQRMNLIRSYMLAYFFALGVGILAGMFLLNYRVFRFIIGSFIAAIILFPINQYGAKLKIPRLSLYFLVGLFAWLFPFLWNAYATTPGRSMFPNDTCFYFYFFVFLWFSLVQGVALFLQNRKESIPFQNLRENQSHFLQAVAGAFFLCAVFAASWLAAAVVQKAFFPQFKTTGELTLPMMLPAGIVINLILGFINSVTAKKASDVMTYDYEGAMMGKSSGALKE